jgi:hypothetical protein
MNKHMREQYEKLFREKQIELCKCCEGYKEDCDCIKILEEMKCE